MEDQGSASGKTGRKRPSGPSPDGGGPVEIH
jgi:hypothetical protein